MISRIPFGKRALAGAAMLALAVMGCQSKKATPASSAMPLNASVTDIGPTPVAIAPIQPVQPIQPVMVAQQPVEAGFASGSAYIVQKGDTLYKIARVKYGDAKQWKKIAAANPEAANGLIKPGQKLIIP